MNVSIWSWGITDDLDTLFSRFVAASEGDFEAVVQSAIEPAPPANEPDLQEIIGRYEVMIKSAKMPATPKADLLQGCATS